MKKTIQFTLNGQAQKITVEEGRRLLWVLRTDLGLTGAKYGCGEGYCGACTVLVNGQPERSCQFSAADAEGKEIITIEGLAGTDGLHPLQKAFVAQDALQCGYCTPGMIMSAYALIRNNPDPSYSEIVSHMEDNLCRCGAHKRIIQAIQAAAKSLQGEGP